MINKKVFDSFPVETQQKYLEDGYIMVDDSFNPIDNNNNNTNQNETQLKGMSKEVWENILGNSLPFKCTVQFGEQWGKHVQWYERKKVTLIWKNEVNLDDESGIAIEGDMSWGYADWDDKTHILGRYYNDDDYQEHVLRIIK